MAGTDVVIAVLTYRRPEGLAEVLRDLREHVAGSRVDASLLVVDNDDEPSSFQVADQPGVRYVHEPTPGIAAARNRALDESEAHRLLVFIDDDERPSRGWLDALVATWEATRPAAVTGPVVSRFTVPPDPWIEAGGFFRRLRHATGTEVPAAATSNLLLDLRVVRDLGLRFDARFALSGGSDTFFTRSLVRAGGRIVWCDEALVTDVVPAERITREWVVRRATRLGNSSSRVALLTAQPGLERAVTRVKLVSRAAVRIVGGCGRVAVGKVTGNERHRARGTRTAARGRGMLFGALGGVVVEYARPVLSAPTAPEHGHTP